MSNLQTRTDVRKLASQTSPGDQWIFAHSLAAHVGSLPLLSGSDAANFRVSAVRFSPAPILWGPAVEDIPRIRGKTFLIYFDDPLGLDYTTTPPTPRAVDQRRKMFEAYLKAVRARLGMEFHKTSWPLAPTEKNLGPQIIEVYEFWAQGA